MKTATICHEVPCDQSVAGRPRYYARQLITPDDLNLEQDYFRSKLRWHNRMLHGWGVVCGARVCKVPKSKANGTNFEPWQVLIKPGYILGPYGDEIILDCARTFDLRTRGVTGITGEPCVDAIDPWCSEVVQEPESDKLYVAVRYKEIQARPVRVQPIGCGCDDSQCENSRFVDGYEFKVLTSCPDSHQSPPNIDGLIKGPIPECPPCPDEPWVVLAEVELDADGNITKIDNCSCRRLVPSLASFWWHCSERVGPTATTGVVTAQGVKVDKVETGTKLIAGKLNPVTLLGEHLDKVKEVDFGDGTNVEKKTAAAGKLDATVKVDSQATAGKRTIKLTDKSGHVVEINDVVTVEAEAAGAAPAGSAEPAATPKSGQRRRGSKGGSSKRAKPPDDEV